MRCWLLPTQRRRPPTIIPMRAHSASASSMLCVVRMMALPAPAPDGARLAARAMTSHMNRRAWGSMPVEGCENEERERER